MGEVSDIRLIVFDVDGVLTDGSLLIDDHGVETKRFHVRDGLAMAAAREAGLQVGILTSRTSRAVTLRMIELKIDLVMQGARDKLSGLEILCERAQVKPQHTAFVGDDLLDLPALNYCGYPIAVGDAVAEVSEVASYQTAALGGRGAAREAIEHILKQQDRWDQVVQGYR